MISPTMPYALEPFDPALPLERASTPPSSWYLDREVLALERESVFSRTWQAAARLDQLSAAGDYVAGEIAGEPYVVVRDGKDGLRAFFNVCRHHATCVARGAGNAERLVCPYHGWSYGLDGRLRSAPQLGRIEAFDRDAHGLIPMEVGSFGPLVFLRPRAGDASLCDHLRPLDGRIDFAGLRFVRRKRYEIDCNWKVFVDNYLDGGYHVSQLHRGLAARLDLADYATEIDGAVSIQSCRAGGGAAVAEDFEERLGNGAVYAFVYPNFMINRYGPIMDTNWVLPLGPDRTLTIFDFYFEAGVAEDPAFVERSLSASETVQQEDIEICESVQRGLGSSAFDRGRYAQMERAAHDFHCRLARDLGC